MRNRYWPVVVLSIIPVSLILYFLFFHEVVVETPPSIKITVNADQYTIGNKKSEDLLSLVKNEFETRQFKTAPGIVLSAGSNTRYQRVADTIALLKQNGYGNVSLDSQR